MITLSNKVVVYDDARHMKIWELRYKGLAYRMAFSTIALKEPAFRRHAAFQLRAARAKIRANPWHPTDPTRNTWPEAVTADTRVDVRFVSGGEAYGMPAGQWGWGDAILMTITHWRLHK